MFFNNVMIKFLSKEVKSSCREDYVELFWVHNCWIDHLWGFVLVHWLAGITIRREDVVWRTLFRSCRQSCWCFAVRNHPSSTLESIFLGMWLFLLLFPFFSEFISVLNLAILTSQTKEYGPSLDCACNIFNRALNLSFCVDHLVKVTSC